MSLAIIFRIDSKHTNLFRFRSQQKKMDYLAIQRQKIPSPLLKIAEAVWPELADYAPERQVIGIGEIAATLYAIPFSIFGVIWLIRATNLNWVAQNLETYLLFGFLVILFNQLRFFLIIELRQNRYGSTDGALTGVPVWAGALLFGENVFWLSTIWVLLQFVFNLRRSESKMTRWGQYRNLSMSLTSETLVPLVAFNAYLALGGPYPFKNMSASTIFIALVMFGIYFLVYALFWGPYLAYHTWAQQTITGKKELQPIIKFFVLAIGLPQLANPFAILAAGLYSQNGLWVFLYFVAGMVVVAYLTRRLSWSAERSRQSSKLLEKLEILGRSIIDAPPDTENLPAILQEHITNMFPAGRLVIWIFPSNILASLPKDWQPSLDEMLPWLIERTSGEIFLSRDSLPWKKQPQAHNPLIVAPIIEVDSGQTIGGIYLELHTLAQPWDRKALQNLCPAIQSLAAQIASALNQAADYQKALAYQRVSEELKLAGDIQTSLLPFDFPNMPGWQFSVTIAPAGETSGDFFDVIPLENNKIGFLIADVLDKGLGPALYMTLSRTLIRIYATEFDLEPDLVFFSTNERILKDTRANLFVTVFFGILDLQTGVLSYSNAGHNPPYLLSGQNGCQPRPLTKTGLPIGIDEEATWQQEEVLLQPGDVLVLYTDGVPDAQNETGDFYKQESLVNVIQANATQSAEDLQKIILDSVYGFVGNAPPFDDITLMVLKRDPEENPGE